MKEITNQAIGKRADQAAALSQRNIAAMHRAFEKWKADVPEAGPQLRPQGE